jgi:hypothetical protein
VRPDDPGQLEGAPRGHPERLELNRSAGGRYYWRLVVVGDIAGAVEQAIAADQRLRDHFGEHASSDPASKPEDAGW